MGQHSPPCGQSCEGCCLVFRVNCRGRSGFGVARGGLRALFSDVPGPPAKHAEIIIETSLMFLASQLTVLSEFLRKVRHFLLATGRAAGRIGTRARARVRRIASVAGLLEAMVRLLVVVPVRGRTCMVGFVGRLVGFPVSVGLVGLVAILLGVSLPVPNVDLLRGDAEFVEVLGLQDIDQGVLDPVGKTLVVSVAEWCVSPSC